MTMPRGFIVLALLILVLFAFTAAAQTITPIQPPAYRLHTLTAEEFIDALPYFPEVELSSSFDRFYAIELLRAAEAEFLAKFSEGASFHDLLIAFWRFSPEIYAANQAELTPAIDMDAWVLRLTERYLLENPVDLDAVNSLHFGGITALVTPHDFDGDSQSEWILDLSVDGGYSDIIYQNYLVAVREGDHYRLQTLGIPYSSGNADWRDRSSWYENLGFQDITGDGSLEWVFRITTDAPGPVNVVFRVMYAFTWRDGQLERIFAHDSAMGNRDDDPALEFSATYTRIDNWECGTTTTQVWDWDGIAYIRLPDEVVNHDCSGRQAEEAMWLGDFDSAARLYDRYFAANAERWNELVECMDSRGDAYCDSSQWLLVTAYFYARRIVAYALIGDQTRVRQLVEELREVRHYVYLEFIDVLLAANSFDAEALCRTAYHYFEEDFRPNSSGYIDDIAFTPGEIRENIYGGLYQMAGYNSADPARAGCDIALFSGVPTATPTASRTPSPSYMPMTPIAPIDRLISDGNTYSPFMLGDYDLALRIVREAPRVRSYDAEGLAYWEALIYDVTGQADAALNAYVALYLDHPGSWWGYMAGLHLERGE